MYFRSYMYSMLSKCVKILIFILVYFAAFQSNSQEKELDSILKSTRDASTQLQTEQAINDAARLIEMAEGSNAFNYLFYGYDYLGQNHLHLKDSIQAAQYARKALEYAVKSNNDTLMSKAYNNLASLLSKRKSNWDESVKMYLKSLEIARKSVRFEIPGPALNLARLYYKAKEYELMPRYLREAEENLQGLAFDVTKDEIRLNMLWGDYFREKGGFNLVQEYYDITYNLIKNRNDPDLALDFYPKYAGFLNAIGRSDNAYKVQLDYQAIKEDLEQARREKDIQKAMAAAGADELRRERNEAELREMLADEKLERKNTQYTLMFVLTGLMLFFLIYMYLSTRTRKSLIKNLQVKNTELKAAKEIAEKSEKAKSNFFSTVSHEMRTPLYGVTGMVNVLQNSSASDDFKEEFESLNFSAHHLLDVINDLLELSKLDDRSFEFHEHTFNMDSLMREIINSFNKSELKNTNQIHLIQGWECPKNLIGDSRRIAQVLLNLLSNAIKFTTNGNIYLRLSCTSGGPDTQNVLFEVEDTGMGIPQANLESIFKEFSQVKNSGGEQKVGTGLGLAIVQKILKKMDSQIMVESQLGHGTKFSFTLRLKIPAEKVKNKKARPVLNTVQHVTPELKDCRILIVDDNKINRLVTKRLLEQKEARIDTAQGGREAIELMSSSEFDIVLMDLQMPEMDGFETVKIIRQFDKETPIIALTASELSSVKNRLSIFGFNDYISKPFDLEDFYRLLAKNLKPVLVTTS